MLLQHGGPNNVALFPTVPVFQWYPRNPDEWQALSQDNLVSILLYGSDAFDNKKNCKILICTIHFIKDSHRLHDFLS